MIKKTAAQRQQHKDLSIPTTPDKLVDIVVKGGASRQVQTKKSFSKSA